jgi:hypothetical protein
VIAAARIVRRRRLVFASLAAVMCLSVSLHPMHTQQGGERG